MAYTDGDLVKAINDAILASEHVKSKFLALFSSESDPSNKSACLKIMRYLLERYLHMRGCWFAKFMKGNQNQTKGQVRANNDATRTKVAFASNRS